jgi:hypothetical protein
MTALRDDLSGKPHGTSNINNVLDADPKDIWGHVWRDLHVTALGRSKIVRQKPRFENVKPGYDIGMKTVLADKGGMLTLDSRKPLLFTMPFLGLPLSAQYHAPILKRI